MKIKNYFAIYLVMIFAIGLVCVVMIVVGCSGKGRQLATPGKWEGTGDQQFRISFNVADDGTIINFYGISYSEACDVQGGFTGLTSSKKEIAIKGGQFEISGPDAKVTGRLVAPDRAEGTLTVRAHHHPQFGECRETSSTWSATVKNMTGAVHNR